MDFYVSTMHEDEQDAAREKPTLKVRTKTNQLNDLKSVSLSYRKSTQIHDKIVDRSKH